MPIVQLTYGAHESVLFLEFGTGDIMFTRGEKKGGTFELIFSQSTQHKIGDEQEGYVGKSSDEIQDVRAVFNFTKPESITALIHSLIEPQKDIFDGPTIAGPATPPVEYPDAPIPSPLPAPVEGREKEVVGALKKEVEMLEDKLTRLDQDYINVVRRFNWIPVSTPPKEGGRYWCYCQEQGSLGLSHFQWNCAYNRGENRWSDNLKSISVTHWMELPDSPKNAEYQPPIWDKPYPKNDISLFGYFDDKSDTPAYDPGLDAICIYCREKLESPVVTPSLMIPGDNRSYFYRLHKECSQKMQDEGSEGHYDSLIIDSIAPPALPIDREPGAIQNWDDRYEHPLQSIPAEIAEARQNQEVPVEKNKRVWPLGAYAPGNYTCHCANCKKQFVGDKRAVQCLECAISCTQEVIEGLYLTIAEQRERLQAEISSLKDSYSIVTADWNEEKNALQAEIELLRKNGASLRPGISVLIARMRKTDGRFMAGDIVELIPGLVDVDYYRIHNGPEGNESAKFDYSSVDIIGVKYPGRTPHDEANYRRVHAIAFGVDMAFHPPTGSVTKAYEEFLERTAEKEKNHKA